MRILVTAGPTREWIDSVRFLTNASSGRMGYAVARAAARAGHKVTLLSGPVHLRAPARCRVVPFVSVAELKAALHRRFAACDALVMAAAVGDFRPRRVRPGKIRRADGPVTVRLVPTEDLLAGLARRKRPGQLIVAFAVEDGTARRIEAKARAEMAAKGSDLLVLNTPAAMGRGRSRACILDPAGAVLPWGTRTKDQLARHIVRLLQERR